MHHALSPPRKARSQAMVIGLLGNPPPSSKYSTLSQHCNSKLQPPPSHCDLQLQLPSRESLPYAAEVTCLRLQHCGKSRV